MADEMVERLDEKMDFQSVALWVGQLVDRLVVEWAVMMVDEMVDQWAGDSVVLMAALWVFYWADQLAFQKVAR